MEFLNSTPLSAEFFRQYNLESALNGVVAVRGSFVIGPDASMVLADDQMPFQWSDVYEGDDPHTSHLVVPADFVPFKPGTDITFLGASFSPDGQPSCEWLCGIRIPGRLEKRLRILGKREWQPISSRTLRQENGNALFQGWQISPPKAASAVPVSWRLAYGGAYPLQEGEELPAEVHRANGLGPGILDAHFSLRDRPLPAPQIEAPDEPIADWRMDYTPQSFAPIPPWWEQRQRFVGTYDDDWIENRHPILPEDFDYRFYQVAHPDLIATPWLQGDEWIELGRLHPQHPLLRVRLPDIQLEIVVKRPGQKPARGPLALDGVHFDFRGGAENVYLTWRAAFPCENNEGEVELFAARGQGASTAIDWNV